MGLSGTVGCGVGGVEREAQCVGCSGAGVDHRALFDDAMTVFSFPLFFFFSYV